MTMPATTIETAPARRQLSLPEELCAAAERRFAPQFENLEALLEFVLRDLIQDNAEALDKNEQALLEQRLRDLGYI
jgi:hypothetical protein